VLYYFRSELHVLYHAQWRSKALRGPGSTVTWRPSIPSASPQFFRSGLFFSCVKFVGFGLRGPQTLGLQFIEPPKPSVSTPLIMPHRTRGSAMAEEPHDALVSRNSATTKHSVWKLESRAYRVALFAWSYTFSRFVQYRSVTDTHKQTDKQTHDDGMYRA